MEAFFQLLNLHEKLVRKTFSKAEHDLLTMIKHGVLTIESKSGYGLDKENELKQLRVSNQLADKYNLDIKHTFLGPHAVPEEAESNEAFLEEMIELLLS